MAGANRKGCSSHSAVFMENTSMVTQASVGYGFASPCKGGSELYLHRNNLKNRKFDDARMGDPVESEIGPNHQGECARVT